MVNQENISLYVPADESFLINDLDPDRKTIRISLPKPPPLETIDGYGEHPDNQFFKRKKTPVRLVEIEKEVLRELQNIKKDNRQETITGYKIIDKFWEKFDSMSAEYEEERTFIKHIWWNRIYGYWFFNNGKPTYITGRHFMFLNFFTMPDVKENEGYPEYRDRHRREYLFRDYLLVAHHTFAKRDERGWALPEEDGHYEMKDLGCPLFYGVIHPKSRRNGSTIMGLSNMIEGAERGRGRYSTLISKDGDSTEEHYTLRLLPAWGNRPSYIKPIWNGSSSPTQIKYFPPKNSYVTDGLMGVIDYTSSAGVVKKDGSKFNGFIEFDEEGKTEVDVLQRWNVYKNSMALGDGTIIIGSCSHDSTVEDINASGKAFLDMLETSDFYQRGETGQTTSGLAAMVFPAYDGQEGFIDFFGMSVIGIPTEKQIKMRPDASFAILGKGALQYQTEKRDDFIKKGTPAAMQSYREYIKKYPHRSSELTLGTSGDMGFDYEIIDKRIAELRQLKSFGKLPVKIGNFYRRGNDPEGLVYWKTEENGRFEISIDIDPRMANLKKRSMGWSVKVGKFIPQWEPVYKSRFTLGADPVEYNNKRDNVDTSRQSDPAMTINWEFDPNIDKGENPWEYETDSCVLFYRYRPKSVTDYCEDVLMAAEYIGAMIYPESNKTRLIEYVIDRGRGGYLKYDVDIKTGKVKEQPGYWAATSSKSDGFGLVKDWIVNHAHKCNHIRLLEEIRNIRSMDELTKYDGLASWIAARMGSQSSYGKMVDNRSQQKVDLSKCSWLRT